MHVSRDLFLLDILIFVKIIREMIFCVAFWNASAEALACDKVTRVKISRNFLIVGRPEVAGRSLHITYSYFDKH